MEFIYIFLYDFAKTIADATGIVIKDVIISAPTVLADIATVTAVSKVKNALMALVFTPASLARTGFIDVYNSP